MIAFKKESVGIKTTVIDVIYEESMDRLLIPRVFYETVKKEANLNWASGKNAKFIIDNGIGPGAEILITRGGDIIPDIVGIVKSVEPTLPDFDTNDYEWDTTATNLILKYDTDTVLSKKIEYFISTMGIRDFGPARIRQMVDIGFMKTNIVIG